LGQAGALAAGHADPVGRGRERRYERGPLTLCPACAVRADQMYGMAKRYVHVETPSASISRGVKAFFSWQG